MDFIYLFTFKFNSQEFQGVEEPQEGEEMDSDMDGLFKDLSSSSSLSFCGQEIKENPPVPWLREGGE